MELRIDKVLCPVDFSDSADHALTYAKAFAQAHDAELILLHVIATPVYLMAPDIGPTADTLARHKTLCESELEKAVAAVQKEHSRTLWRLEFGVPFLKIVQWARAENIDLIVMGTHGRSGLVHALMGSVSEKVVRKAPCPVLTVKHPEHEFVMP